MRESIGAGWLTTIVIAFIVLFSAFLAFSINYAKAFRVKDGIIDEIEKTEGFTEETMDNIRDYLSDIGYVNSGSCFNFMQAYDEHQPVYGVNINSGSHDVQIAKEGEKYNYCIQKVKAKNDYGVNDTIVGTYYKVYVFFNINLPIVNDMNIFNLKGETSYMLFAKDILNK